MARTALSAQQQDSGQRIAETLGAARRRKGLSVAEVAASAGVAVDTLKSLESKRSLAPTFWTVARLARTLRVPIGELAKLVDDQDGSRK